MGAWANVNFKEKVKKIKRKKVTLLIAVVRVIVFNLASLTYEKNKTQQTKTSVF